jgi:PAS domain S-box-containing protein
MASRSGFRKKSGSTNSGDAVDKDRLIAELKDRVAFLENELLLKREDATTPNTTGCLEAELKYSWLLATLFSGFWIADNEGRFLEVNDACCRILGYTREELLSMSIADVEAVESPANVQSHIQALRQKTYDYFISRHRRKDGSIIDVEVNASYLDIGEGSVVILFNDITERKRAEDALQFERLQLLSIFDSIDEVIYVTDPYTHEILYANRAMQDKFGKILTGGICYREMQDKDAPCEFCTNDIILRNKGEPYRWEFHNPTVNMDFDIVDRIIKWPDGRDVRFEIALDVTERKRAEVALRESEEKYRELVENANSIIIRWDMHGNLTFFNEFAEMLFGYSQNEALGRNVVGTIVPLSESTGRDMDDMIEDVKRYPERYKLNVNENICKNGDRVWIAWTNKAIRDEHGNVVEILSVGNDITERKRAEEELKAAKAQAELYVDLMGHDINNIHQAALGYLEFARDMPADARDEYMDKATEALKRSAQLINNVRKLQKLQDSIARAHDVDLCAVLDGVYGEYALTQDKTLTLNLNGFTHCHVRADDLLHDVFSNLVGNAMKHTGDNASVSINLGIGREHGIKYYRVQVDDDGPGIPDESKNMLFNRSLKGTPRAKGMGLGLYIVKTLVENYGGQVWAEDRIEGDHTKGARFVVMLPAVETGIR